MLILFPVNPFRFIGFLRYPAPILKNLTGHKKPHFSQFAMVLLYNLTKKHVWYLCHVSYILMAALLLPLSVRTKLHGFVAYSCRKWLSMNTCAVSVFNIDNILIWITRPNFKQCLSLYWFFFVFCLLDYYNMTILRNFS